MAEPRQRTYTQGQVDALLAAKDQQAIVDTLKEQFEEFRKETKQRLDHANGIKPFIEARLTQQNKDITASLASQDRVLEVRGAQIADISHKIDRNHGELVAKIDVSDALRKKMHFEEILEEDLQYFPAALSLGKRKTINAKRRVAVWGVVVVAILGPTTAFVYSEISNATHTNQTIITAPPKTTPGVIK